MKLLAYRGVSWISKAIRWQTRSKYSHIAIELEDGSGQFIELLIVGDKNDSKIPIGVFYKIQKPTYEKQLLGDLIPAKRKKEVNLKKALEELK